MEVEKDNQLVFLYSLDYHTNRYLNANSHHQPGQLHSVVFHQAYGSKNKQGEIKTTQTVSRLNRDRQKIISRALQQK